MGNHARKVRNGPRDRELPPCEQAQADGVPCTELGRACETCEQAARARKLRESPPELKPEA